MLTEKLQQMKMEKLGSKKNHPTKFGFTWDLPFSSKGAFRMLKNHTAVFSDTL